MATLLASFAVPLLWRAPRAALQPLVGPGALLVLSVCFEGAGKSAQQSAWLFGAAMVVHAHQTQHR